MRKFHLSTVRKKCFSAITHLRQLCLRGATTSTVFLRNGVVAGWGYVVGRLMVALGGIKSAMAFLLGRMQTLAATCSDFVLDAWRILVDHYRQALDFARTPWSILQVARRDESEWFAANERRRQMPLSRLERELLFAGEHPIRFSGSLVALQLALFVFVDVLPADWLTMRWGSWGVEEQIAYFSTVWTIQATVAALVYPIVISFVAVFLQRRPAAEAFVRLYMLDSGGAAAGLSSLVLVVVMSVQYLMLTTWDTKVLPAWAALDTGWFILNSVLTTYFLFRTIEFLRPELQTRVVQRYAINVALPRDVARLNLFQVLAGAQGKGWLPVPAYGDDGAPEGAHMLIGRYSFREGDTQGELRLRGPSRLVDVRIWLVRLAVTSWFRKATKHPRPTDARALGVRVSWPLLTLPITPGTVFKTAVPLARVADGPPLTTWERLLLRLALVMRPTSGESSGIRVEAILDELEFDARQAASRGDSVDFERSYGALVAMHELLLGACLAPDEKGQLGSWAMLPDTENLFGKTLHEKWSESYRSIFKAAIRNMANETQPLLYLCHLLQHLEGKQLRESPAEIQEHLLQLPPLMMYQLGNWWVHRLEEQGVMDHGHHKMVVLRPPLNRVYEEVLSSFVAGWENGRPSSTGRRNGNKEFDWTSAPTQARVNARHIEETARMLLAAVHRGDQAAAEWLADVLSKWWGTFDDERVPYQLLDKTAFITLDHLQLDWGKFRVAFDLAESESDGGALEPTLQHDCYLAALRNYWTDVRLLVVELLLNWVARTTGPPPNSSLAVEIIVGLLLGKQWKSGGQAVDSLVGLSAADYLTAKVRQYAASGDWRGGYIGRLDRFVERVKDMDRPNMVSSRVYSFSGADDVGSLQDSQLSLLAILSTAQWGVSRALQRQIDLWSDEQYASIDIVRSHLGAWLERLGSVGELPTVLVTVVRLRVKGEQAGDSWETVKAGLNALQQAIDTTHEEKLAAQPVDPERLLEIGRFASTKGFQAATGDFPIGLFKVDKVDGGLQDFTLTLKKVRKGELTRVKLDQRAANEADLYAEMLTRQVAVVVLTDVLQRCAIKEMIVSDADAYWLTLKAEAAKVISRGGKPILLLDNPTRPAWVWDWQHSDFGADYRRPDDLRVQRLDGRGSGYVCNFNDIEVFNAPIPPGQSLMLSRAAFERVYFTCYGEERFVNVSTVGMEDEKKMVDVKLTFSRKVEVGDRDAVLLIYSDGNDRK